MCSWPYEENKVIFTPVIKESMHAEVERALIAVAHTMLIVIYRILKEKVLYHDLGTDCYSVINQEKLIKRNLHVLEKLGMDVIIQPK